MTVAISTLTTPSWTTMVDGQGLPAATLNSGFNSANTAIGNLNSVVGELENSFAGTSTPTDTPAGKWWFNSSSLNQQYYEVAGGTLRTVVSTDRTQTLTNKTISGGGSNSYVFPDLAARTINVSGVDQNSYVSATGTTGNSNSNVKSVTLKGGSLNAVGRAIRVTIMGSGAGSALLYVSFGGTNIFTAANISGVSFQATIVIAYLAATTVNTLYLLLAGAATSHSETTNVTVSSLASDQSIIVFADGTHNITVNQILVEQLG